MSQQPDTAIPPGSWVLITAVTGFLGSHMAGQFLERGYRVRGAVRDPAAAAWLLDDAHFGAHAARGHFALVTVPDLDSPPDVLDAAVRGVSAVVHMASVLTLHPDPEVVVSPTVRGVTNLLEAALRTSAAAAASDPSTPAVRRFVYTSSIAAATMPVPENPTRVERDTWNELAVRAAWAPPPYDETRPLMAYVASKVEAERALWRFVEERKPPFAVSTVNSGYFIGRPLHRKHVESVGAWLRFVVKGEMDLLRGVCPVYVLDVRDVALVHVAAVLDPEVRDARLQTWGHPCNWNVLLAILRKRYPQRTFIDDLPGQGEVQLSTDQNQALALLKKWGGQDGWTSLEQAIAENMEGMIEMGY